MSLKYFKVFDKKILCYGKLLDFVSFPLFGLTLVKKTGNFDFESHWNTIIFFDKRRYWVRFKYLPWKNVWFCFIFIVSVHFSHKTDKLRFWKSLKYFNFIWSKKDIASDFSMFHGNISDFIWFPLFGFTLVKKLRNFDFESHSNS